MQWLMPPRFVLAAFVATVVVVLADSATTVGQSGTRYIPAPPSELPVVLIIRVPAEALVDIEGVRTALDRRGSPLSIAAAARGPELYLQREGDLEGRGSGNRPRTQDQGAGRRGSGCRFAAGVGSQGQAEIALHSAEYARSPHPCGVAFHRADGDHSEIWPEPRKPVSCLLRRSHVSSNRAKKNGRYSSQTRWKSNRDCAVVKPAALSPARYSSQKRR